MKDDIGLRLATYARGWIIVLLRRRATGVPGHRRNTSRPFPVLQLEFELSLEFSLKCRVPAVAELLRRLERPGLNRGRSLGVVLALLLLLLLLLRRVVVVAVVAGGKLVAGSGLLVSGSVGVGKGGAGILMLVRLPASPVLRLGRFVQVLSSGVARHVRH